MNLAINTASLSDDTAEALDRAAALGFDTVEVTLQPDEFGYGYRRRPDVKLYRTLRQQLDENKLSAWSVSAPQLTQRQMFSPRARREILINGAGAAGVLGAKVYVVEPAHLFANEDITETYFREQTAPPVVDGFDEAWAQVVNRRMTFAVDNASYWIGLPLLNNAERMAKVTRDLGIGWSGDLRRASTSDITQWLTLCGERLAVAHAYDLAEDGETRLTPEDEQWADWLAPLADTRLKTVVLHGHPNQDDNEFIAARARFEAMFS